MKRHRNKIPTFGFLVFVLIVTGFASFITFSPLFLFTTLDFGLKITLYVAGSILYVFDILLIVKLFRIYKKNS
ncbi:MAG: hypothetical protein ACRC5M_01785, partial [Anaeroplasmataceae bacterium]